MAFEHLLISKLQIPTFLCSRKNFRPLFSAGIVLPLEFWNYTFHPIRTTHAILPGYTSPGTIKGSAKHMRSLFSLLIPLSWQLGKTSRHERQQLSLIRDDSNSRQGLTISREHTSAFVPLHTLGDHFLVKYFSLLNQMDPMPRAKH